MIDAGREAHGIGAKCLSRTKRPVKGEKRNRARDCESVVSVPETEEKSELVYNVARAMVLRACVQPDA